MSLKGSTPQLLLKVKNSLKGSLNSTLSNPPYTSLLSPPLLKCPSLMFTPLLPSALNPQTSLPSITLAIIIRFSDTFRGEFRIQSFLSSPRKFNRNIFHHNLLLSRLHLIENKIFQKSFHSSWWIFWTKKEERRVGSTATTTGHASTSMRQALIATTSRRKNRKNVSNLGNYSSMGVPRSGKLCQIIFENFLWNSSFSSGSDISTESEHSSSSRSGWRKDSTHSQRSKKKSRARNSWSSYERCHSAGWFLLITKDK